MTASTDYDDYRATIARALAPGFGFAEICRPHNRRFVLPPERMWPRIIRPLQLANELRAIMIKDHGANGLRCNAAYRPDGGAPNSQHRHNRALDLDLLPRDYGLTRVYYEEAVRLWCEYGHNERFGLGLYCSRDVQQGIRVHIDIGYYTRTWQHGAGTGRADAFLIAERLGLDVPVGKRTREVDDESSDDENGAAA